MVKTVISDLGGVLLNRGIWIFWDYLEEEYNIPSEKSRTIFLKYYKQYFSGKISEKSFWDNFLSKLNLNENWKFLRNKLLNFFKPNEKMIKLYSDLRKKGYELILLSDQTKEWWPYLDETYNISSYFDITIISALVGLHKPNVEIYEYTLKQTKSKASDCLFIDDLEHNLIPAKKLGIQTILFEDCDKLKIKLKEKNLI